MRIFGTALLSLALGVAAAEAQDATAFQLNAAHTGSVAMPGFKPPLKLLWKRHLVGAETSYPLIVDGVIYVTIIAHVHGDFEGTTVYALDAQTGKTKWKKYINNKTFDNLGDEWSNATYDNGQVFVLDLYNVLTSYNAKTGKVVWSQVEGRYDLQNDGAPPVASDGAVYIVPRRINEADGMIRWSGNTEGGIGVSPPAIGDGGMYMSFACSALKLGLTDGVRLWKTREDCGGGATTAQFLDNQVFVRDPSGQIPNSILDSATGETLGTFPTVGFNLVPALYKKGNRRFMVAPTQSLLTQYDITDPASVVSTWSTGLNNEHMASPALVVNDYVIEGTEAGGLYVLDSKGKIAWSTKLDASVRHAEEHGGGPLGGMAAGDGILVVPTEDQNDHHQAIYAFAPQ